MRKDGEECPRDGNRAREVTFWTGEGIRTSSALKEEPGG